MKLEQSEQLEGWMDGWMETYPCISAEKVFYDPQQVFNGNVEGKMVLSLLNVIEKFPKDLGKGVT